MKNCMYFRSLLSVIQKIASLGLFALAMISPLAAANASNEPALTIYVDKAPENSSPTAQIMHVYEKGWDRPVLFSVISTGRENSHEVSTSGNDTASITPLGSYTIQWRSKNHVSSQWEGAKMPFAQFFKGGIALHGVIESLYEKLGSRASGGCIRLPLYVAEELWYMVERVGMENVKVVVYDSSDTTRPLPRSFH